MSSRFAKTGSATHWIIAALVVVFFVGGVFLIGIKFLMTRRAIARDLHCRNQLRSVALGIHNYHDAYKRLPAATLGATEPELGNWEDPSSGDYWKNFQNTSALALIGPFMERQQLIDQVEPAAFNLFQNLPELREANKISKDVKWQGDLQGTVTVAQVVCSDLVCPADSINSSNGKVAIASQPVIRISDPQEDIVLKFWDEEGGSERLAATNYIACGGVIGGQQYANPADRVWAGMMTCREKWTLESTADGTSCTLMFGETVGGIQEGTRGSAYSWFWAGYARGRGDTFWDGTLADSGFLGDMKNSSAVGFGSAHSRHVNFALGDASIAALSREIDPEVFMALCAARDGSAAARDYLENQ